MAESVGKRLREARLARGWNQKDLASALGVGQQSVSRWERDLTTPAADLLDQLAELFPATDLGGARWSPRGVDLPVRPLLTQLPFPSLTPQQFESFCRDLLRALHPEAEVSSFGVSGDPQEGIDIRVVIGDETWAVQCKRVAEFGRQRMLDAVRAVTMPADRYLLMLSREATVAAREEIDRHPHWVLWDQDQLSAQVRALDPVRARRLVETYFPEHLGPFLGAKSGRAWMEPGDYFAPFMSPDRPFNHTWPIHGRAVEIAAVIEAVRRPEPALTLVVGAGGSGKTRLLRAVADELSTRSIEVLFARPFDDIERSDLEEVGRRAAVLIIDDAHDRSGIERLLVWLTERDTHAAVVLVTRPQAKDLILSTARRCGLVGDAVTSIDLTALPRDVATELAREVLGSAAPAGSTARRLAWVTGGEPFALTVGGHLVASQHIDPMLLASEQEFRQSLFDHFSETLVGDPDARAVLDLVALLQPVNPADSEFRDLADRFVDLPAARFDRVVAGLVDSGVLRRTAEIVRVAPDLFADYLAEQVAYDPGVRRLTATASDVLAAVGGSLFHNVLVNLSKLDWRLTATGDTGPGLLMQQWIELADDFRAAGFGGRERILKLVSSVAQFQPAWALEFARIAIEEPTERRDPEDGYVASLLGQPYTYRSVLDEVPPLLAGAALHIDHVAEAAELLWKIARDEPHSRGSRRSAGQTLQDLAALEPAKPVEYVEVIVDRALSWLDGTQGSVGAFSPFDVLEPILATEGHTTEFTGRQFSMRPFSISAPAVEALRLRIVDACFSKLQPEVNLSVALRALKLLEQATRAPSPILGHEPDAEDQAAWEPGIGRTIERLETVARSGVDPVVLVGLRRALRWRSTHDNPQREKASSVLAAIPESVEFNLTSALLEGNWETYDADEAWEAHQERFARRLDSQVEMLQDHCSVVEAMKLLEDRLSAIREAGGLVTRAHGMFAWRLVDLWPDLGRAVLDEVQSHADSSLGDIVDAILGRWCATFPDDGIQRARALLEAGDVSLRRSVAISCGYLQGDALLQPDAMSLVRRLLADPDAGVQRTALQGLWGLAQAAPVATIELLLEAGLGENGNLLEESARYFARGQPLAVDQMSAHQRERLLDGLSQAPSLEGHSVGELVGELSVTAPVETLELLISRLEREGAGAWVRGSEAIPFEWGSNGPLRFRDSSRFTESLVSIIKWAADAPDTRNRRDAAQLFSCVAGALDEQVVSTLSGAAAAGDAATLRSVAALVSEAPMMFVFEQVDFVRELLTLASRHDPVVQRDVRSWLSRSASSGTRSGVPGEPFPEDVAQRDECRKLIAALSRTDPARRFYVDLERAAEQSIEWALRVDELDGFG